MVYEGHSNGQAGTQTVEAGMGGLTCAIWTASAVPLMVTFLLRVPGTKSSRSEMRILTPTTLFSWLITYAPCTPALCG